MSIRDALNLAGLVGSGLIAGVFFAFSAFVLRALAKLPPASGMAAMQSVNVVVLNPLFLGVFMGTAIVGLAAGVAAIVGWDPPGSGWMLAAALCYVVGTFGATVVGNVPLNESLARVAVDATDAAQQWSSYVDRWAIWNHVRTVAAVVATLGFAVAFRAGAARAPAPSVGETGAPLERP